MLHFLIDGSNRAEDEVFFIYDTTVLQKEEDEIKDAILYFYPTAIPEHRQWELCGQLVGVLQCVLSLTDSHPKSISLQKSKLAVRQINRFLIALGGAQSELDGSLQRMIDALLSLFNFYHEGLEKTEKSCEENKENFKNYIQSIWETYLPLYRHMGDSLANTFTNLPYLHIPKHSSCLFLRATHLLQICSRHRGVLGGCLVFKDRILCTELSPELTSKLLVIRPKQRNFPGKTVDTEFKLPSGVRILSVYLTSQEAQDLQPAKPPWLQHPGTSHCTFQSIYEDETYDPGSDRISNKSPTNSSLLTDSVTSQSSVIDPSHPATYTPSNSSSSVTKTYKQSDSYNVYSLDLNKRNRDVDAEFCDTNVAGEEMDTNTSVKCCPRESENSTILEKEGDCGVQQSRDLVPENTKTVATDDGGNHAIDDRHECRNSKSAKMDTPDGCCSSKRANINDFTLPSNVINDTSANGLGSNVETSAIKCSETEIKGAEVIRNSENIKNAIESQKSSVKRDVDSEINSCKKNNTGENKRSDSSPNLHAPSDELPVAHKCLQKLHSEERSADLLQEKLSPKSTSCMELSRQSSLDKESQTKFLFRRVKRVVSNSGAIKNYQMLCNTSMEELSQNSADLIANDSYPPFHTSFDHSTARLSLSGQSSNQSPPEVFVSSSSSFRVLKIESRHSIEESSTHLKLPDSPNSAKFGLSGGTRSPALSTRSLNVSSSRNTTSHSSSDEVFRVRHHSLDKTTKIPPQRRRSRKSTTSSDKMRESQKAVSFKEQSPLPTGVFLGQQGVKLPDENLNSPPDFTASSMIKEGEKPLCPHHLYIQGNSELLLMLILQHGLGADQQTVNSLWRCVLPQLGELDMLVKQCTDDSSQQNSESGLNFLTYNGNQNQLGGNIREPITAIQHQFCEAVANAHEDFIRMPHLIDIKLRGHNTSVYGHRQGELETYIQPRGMMKPPIGRPNERDVSIAMDTKDLHRLAKQLDHAIL